jgi:DNA polymerase-3 subunit alpha
MPTPNFVHLRLHSEYSIVDGIVRLDDAIQRAVEHQMGALALTDLSNLFGLIKFYSNARNAGVKPIAGADVWISHPSENARPHRGLLLVKNSKGYLNLCELLSKATIENQHLGRQEIHPSWFSLPSSSTLGTKEPFTLAEGLIFLSGGMQGDVGQSLLQDQLEQAEQQALFWAKTFPQNYYLEISRVGHEYEERYIHQVASLASRLKLPLVATQPIHFMKAQDFRAHETRVCVADGELLGNPKRVIRFTQEQYFKSQEQMVDLFADLPTAVTNTVEIAKRCNLVLQLGKPRLPDFPTPNNLSLEAYLEEQSHSGLKKRLEHLYPDQQLRDQEQLRYVERLDFEIKTIVQMGFPGYFLIVADFISWAKNNGVPVGPGRGSGAGSLVAYSLGITDLDPLRYNLLFERFLNPERVSMPDFDIDFCQLGRDKVIQYVKEKYGHDSVSQIATFGTMAARGAIKDVGRVLQQPYGFVDSISKLIEAKPGAQITIDEAIKSTPDLRDLYDNNEEAKNLIDLALQLEGITRNVGMHAGGVLISPGQLTDFCPLYSQSGKDEQNSGVVSQFDKDDVEAVGLVKFDFLGLTTLTILDLTEKYIQRLYPEKKNWLVGDVPLDDPAAFDILKKANTVAIFQLESRGMQNMLRDAKPDRFEDIIALVALYRPGPMDLIPDYIARKHKKQVVIYPDDRVIPVLEETYGIMVYQEQVMQMAQIVGGYSLGGADLLRRAMGKKKPEEMAIQSKIFAEGAIKNGLTQEKADDIFKNMEAFAGYGFNKSHAAAYAVLAYQTAWLKAHYVAEFMAANLSLAMDDTDKVKILYEDAKANFVEILSPDINSGEYRFVPLLDASDVKGSRRMKYGLGAVRGTGENAIQEIVRVRTEKPFVHLFDFCQRVDRRIVNRRAIEALIRGGAFDSLHPSGMEGRATLLASVPNAMQAAEQAIASANQTSLFAMPGEEEGSEPEYVESAPWFEKKRLQEEKAALGFCISGHLFDAYEAEVRKIVGTPLNKLSNTSGEKLVAGMIVSHRTRKTSNGGVMNTIILDDATDQIELIVYEDIFENYRSCFKEDELLIAKIQTKVQPANENFGGSTRHSVQAAMTMATARLRYAKSLHFEMTSSINIQHLKEKAQSYLNEHRPPNHGQLIGSNQPMSLPLTAEIFSESGVCQIQFPQSWNLYPEDRVIQGFSNVLHLSGITSPLKIKYSV